MAPILWFEGSLYLVVLTVGQEVPLFNLCAEFQISSLFDKRKLAEAFSALPDYPNAMLGM